MANKKVDLYKGQTKGFQCKATYEGKNAVGDIAILPEQADYKNLVEPMTAEVNEDGIHMDVDLRGLVVGNGTVTIPFGHGEVLRNVEGVDVSTINVDVAVTEANLVLVPQANVFDYTVDGTYDLLISLTDGTNDLVLNDDGIAFMDSQAMIDIITVGPDRLMIKPNAGWVPDPGAITGKITVMYYTASVEVSYTFNVPDVPRILTATVEGGIIPTFGTGEKQLTIKDQNDAPVTDAEFISVNVSTENGTGSVFEYVGQYLRAVDAANGVYAFDYAGRFMGAKVTLAFKIRSGTKEHVLNPVMVEFSQEPLTAVFSNPTVIPKGTISGSIDMSINIRRIKGANPVPITGYFGDVVKSGANLNVIPSLESIYRIRTLRLTGIPQNTSGVALLISGKFYISEFNAPGLPILAQVPKVPG